MTAHGGRGTLDHQALLYGSPGEFVSAMAPFARTGLERGDVVVAASKRPNIDALREELGMDSRAVQLEDTAEWMIRPFDRLHAFKQTVAGLPPGRSLSAMGEPIWEGSAAARRQWARYESVINLALTDAPMRFVCLYDSSALPDEILERATQTHPTLVAPGGARTRSPGFVDPIDFMPAAVVVPPPEAVDLAPEGTALRASLTRYAHEHGIDGRQLGEIALATSEVAANAVRHGGGPRRAVVWTEDGELVCQITDAGDGIGDPLAGWIRPETGSTGGWGLPIARYLADVVEIDRCETGATVTLFFTIENDRCSSGVA